MPINLGNRKFKQIYFSDNNKNVKEIVAAYTGSTAVYAKKFNEYFYNDATFTVPKGVTRLNVECAAGQGMSFTEIAYGGLGGLIVCQIKVYEGLVLYLKVGKQYTDYTQNRNDSIIYLNGDQYQPIIHVGGGGSAANPVWIRNKQVHGGAGGGSVGGVGNADAPTSNIVSQGGTQSAGGDGPYVLYPNIWGYDGRVAHRGNRFTGGSPYVEYDQSVGGYRTGCGGAGYFGGGGGLLKYYLSGSGSYETWAIGGGGGSSYYNPSYIVDGTSVSNLQGQRQGNGYIRLYN